VRLSIRASEVRFVVRRKGLATLFTTPLVLSWAIASCFVMCASSALAAEVRVQIARGPYYIGEAFEVQVIATDFEEEPAPEISVGVYGGISLRLLGVSPSTSTSISIINGKMTRVHEVTFVYRYELTGTRAGRVRIPEFLVAQAAVSGSTRSFEVEISGVPMSNLVGVELELPDGPIFVGQKIPIAVEFRIDRQMQADLVSYQVHVPLFDSPALRFLDEPLPGADTHLEVHTQAGRLRLPATSREQPTRGRSTLVVRAERIMIAVSPDEIHAEAAKVFVSRGVGFRRDVFNQRRVTSTEKFMAKDQPVSIEVSEVPRRGRPESFAGAVGQGFSLEVTADRSVVQLGEPILLSFHLRGDGDLSSASLPPLDAEGLLDPTKFRLPEDSPAGILDEDGKHFDVTLRVLDSGVREIPALAYSWFDAGTRGFETTSSRPIALSVGAAEVIGADAVARRSGNAGDSVMASNAPDFPEESTADGPSRAASEARVVRSTSLALTGANLAVERDPSKLLRDDRAQRRNRRVAVILYGAGLTFFGFAFFDARRRAADPLIVQRTQALKRAERAIEEAFARPEAEAAAALGRSLRELLAELPSEAGPAVDQLISECDTLRFARESGTGTPRSDTSGSLSESLRDRARQLIHERMKLPPDGANSSSDANRAAKGDRS
jgi:hypothetical protein